MEEGIMLMLFYMMYFRLNMYGGVTVRILG